MNSLEQLLRITLLLRYSKPCLPRLPHTPAGIKYSSLYRQILKENSDEFLFETLMASCSECFVCPQYSGRKKTIKNKVNEAPRCFKWVMISEAYIVV